MTSATKQFPDIGLRFGVFDAMLRAGTLQSSDLEPMLTPGVAAASAQEDFWAEEDGERVLSPDAFKDDVLQRVLDNLGDIKLSKQQLASVTHLHFDGGNQIYMFFEARTSELLGLEEWELNTGGHSDVYDVNGFEGVQILTNLEFVNLDAHGSSKLKRDLEPFRAHQSLKEFVIYSPKKRFTNFDAITHLID